jgi:hypothetical protein
VNPEKIKLDFIRFGAVPPSFIRRMVEEDASCICVDESMLLILSLPEITEEEQQSLRNPALLYYSRNETDGVLTPMATIEFEGLVSVDVPFYVFSNALNKNSVDILLVDSTRLQIRGYRKTSVTSSLLSQLQADMKTIQYDGHYLDRIYDLFNTHSSEMLMEKSVHREVLL